MTGPQMTMLHPSDPFPPLTVKLPDCGSLQLHDALAGHFGVMLFYRGSWCSCCNAQLRAFQRSPDGLTSVGAKVAARSVDDKPRT